MLDHPDLGADEIAVLVALARYSDERGTCHPSQSTIAAHLRRSRPWVNLRLKTLASMGLLEKHRHHLPKGGETSCRYRLPTLDITSAARPDLLSIRPPFPSSDADRYSDTPCPTGVTVNLDLLEGKEPSLFAWAGTRAEKDDGFHDHDQLTAPPAKPADPGVRPDEPAAIGTPGAAGTIGPAVTSAIAAAVTPAKATAGAAVSTPPTAWHPTPEDLSWAARTRPDIDADQFTRKFLAKQAILGPFAGDHSHRWRLWLIDERVPHTTTSRATTARSPRPPHRLSAPTRRSEAPAGRAAPVAPAARPATPAMSPLSPPAPDPVSRAGRIAAQIAARLTAAIPAANPGPHP